MKVSDLTGRNFGRLFVVERDWDCKGVYWACDCSCGVRKSVRAGHLVDNKIRSCGCLGIESRKQNRTHGKSKTRTYSVWAGMLRRCRNPKESCYPRYGGKGIKVCDRWLSFENFLSDMGEAPVGLTLERKNSSGDYDPGNCVWATTQQQTWNRECTRWITVCGQRIPLGVACSKFSIWEQTIYTAVRRKAISHTEAFYNTLERQMERAE